MDKLDFSALCSRPHSEKSGACVEDVASITSAVQDFPLPQVQDVSFGPCYVSVQSSRQRLLIAMLLLVILIPETASDSSSVTI